MCGFVCVGGFCRRLDKVSTRKKKTCKGKKDNDVECCVSDRRKHVVKRDAFLVNDTLTDVEVIEVGEEGADLEQEPDQGVGGAFEKDLDFWHEASDDKDGEGKDAAKEGCGERRKEKRDAGDQHNLHPIEEDGLKECRFDVFLLVKDEQREQGGEECKLGKSGEEHTEILTEHELRAVDWFGEKGVECAFVDFFVDEADAGKDGDEDAKEGDGAESEVFGDFDVMPKGEFTEREGSEQEEKGKEEDRVEDLVADGFAEGILGDDKEFMHRDVSPVWALCFRRVVGCCHRLGVRRVRLVWLGLVGQRDLRGCL